MGAEPEVEVDDGDVELEEAKPQGADKDESKAMDKITDHVNDSEIDASKVQHAMFHLAKATQETKKKEQERDRELAKVKVNAEDIEVIAKQFELDAKRAERVLREHDGEVIATLTSLLNEWPDHTPKIAKDEGEFIAHTWKPKTTKAPLPTKAAPEPEKSAAKSADTHTSSTASSRPSSARPNSAKSAKASGKKKKK